MKVIDFETAKVFTETFGHVRTVQCYDIWTIDNHRLVDWTSMEADYYLKDNSRFYSALSIQESVEYIESNSKYRIYVTPRFDGFDNAQCDTYFEIYVNGQPGGRDYSSDAHVGSKEESYNRAIIETCKLIQRDRENGKQD